MAEGTIGRLGVLSRLPYGVLRIGFRRAVGIGPSALLSWRLCRALDGQMQDMQAVAAAGTAAGDASGAEARRHIPLIIFFFCSAVRPPGGGGASHRESHLSPGVQRRRICRRRASLRCIALRSRGRLTGISEAAREDIGRPRTERLDPLPGAGRPAGPPPVSNSAMQ